ncbi:MAG: hypothetical protein H0X49_14785 [Acidobacteria bacterium]|nr:hypothetical protein [Acidobacteriota bacterium]
MTALPKKKKYTPEQYLALEEKAEYKSEYVNGYISKWLVARKLILRLASTQPNFLLTDFAENVVLIKAI